MKLKDLKAQVGNPPAAIETDEGKLWFNRYKRADDWYEKESADWFINAALYQRPYATITTKDGGIVVVKIPWAKAYIDNLATDLYFRNPDSFVDPRVDSPDARAIARGARELARTLDDDLGTVHHVHRGIIAWGYAGFGGIWTTHEQQGQMVPQPLLDENDQPVVGPEGEPLYQKNSDDEVIEDIVIDDQRLVEEYVEPHLLRFDPDGTDWLGLEDFRYIFRLYSRSLYEVWMDEDFEKEDRKRLVWFASGHGRRHGASTTQLSYNTREEEDCRYMPVMFAEGWSKVERRIVHMPVGANFLLRNAHREDGAFLWPRGLRGNRGRYPLRLISDGYTVPIEKDENHYPVPLLRHVRALIEDYVRIYDRLLAAGDGIVKKYFTFKGIIDRTSFRKFAAGDATDVHELDPEKMREFLGVAEDGVAPLLDQLQKVLALVPTRDAKDEILAYAAQLDRIERIFWQMTGQGPGDRGGVSPSATATEATVMAAALQKRTSTGGERLADAHDDINEIRFLLLSEHQTLPIPYRESTSAFDDARWQQFNAQVLRGLSLSFRHVVGSTRPPTRAQVKAERSELFAKVAPFFDLIRHDRTARRLLMHVLEPYDVPSIEEMFEDPLPELAKEVFRLNLALKNGQIPAAQVPAVAARLKELEMMMADAILTQSEKQALALEGGGGVQASAPGSGGAASAPSGSSAQQRATMAAAGMEAAN